jgi:hypothetical protein
MRMSNRKMCADLFLIYRQLTSEYFGSNMEYWFCIRYFIVFVSHEIKCTLLNMLRTRHPSMRHSLEYLGTGLPNKLENAQAITIQLQVFASCYWMLNASSFS